MGVPTQTLPKQQVVQQAPAKPATVATAATLTAGNAALESKAKQIQAVQSAASTPAAPKTYNYTNPYSPPGYKSSATKGAVGPGGAQFGMGAGGKYRFDYTVQPQENGYAGLWSQGIDYRDPNAANAVMQWYDSQPSNVKAEVDSFWKNNNKSGNAALDMMRAVDWRTRDVARKIQKENGFLDSTFGQILSTLGQVALGAVPGVGPALSAGLGAVTGGLQGGIGGALLGGLGGYGAGSLGSSLATNGISGTISNAIDSVKSGFDSVFGSGSSAASTGASAINAAANAVPGASSGITTPAGGAAIIGSGSAAPITGLAGSGGAALGASPLAVAGGALAAGANPATVSAITNAISGGAPGVTTTGGVSSIPSGNVAPVSTPSANPANVVQGTGAATTGSSTISSILGALGGTGGLGSSALSLLQGILGQMGSSDLEKLASKLNQTNQNMINYIPPMSYRDNILSNLDMIMNKPNQLMEQAPYKNYMDYVQRAMERKMAAQGYGGVGQSTNTADAVTRATLESMANIVQNDRQIATQQLLPFFNVGVQGATNMNNGNLAELNAFNNMNNVNNWTQIAGGAAGILKSIFD